MTAPILVVSHTHDAHASEVLARLHQRGADAMLFDTGRVPREVPVTIDHCPERAWAARALSDGRWIDLHEVRSVWWRRPQPYGLHAEMAGGEDRHFALAEVDAAVTGLWSLLDARWINDPDLDQKAGRKAWQLKVAREVGLAIPRTCITSDPSRAREFVESAPGQVIYKAFQGTEQSWRETRVLKPGERDLLNGVRYAPVIFQDYVPARVDLRITIVGDRLFPAEIHSQSSAYPIDFRMDMATVAIEPHALPDAVAGKLLALMRRFGLVYGAVDMRQTPEGEYVFLEINPAGQWLFVEYRTGQPISDALADTLIAFSSGPADPPAPAAPARRRARSPKSPAGRA